MTSGREAVSDLERTTVLVAENRRAKRDYEILDRLEVGMCLRGSEVKTLRNGKVSLAESFVKYKDNEIWLEGAHIEEFAQAAEGNHDPLRSRKLLARKRQIEKWGQRVKEKGLTIIPLRIYFLGCHAKLEIGLCRGRKRHDKRQRVKDRDDRRAIRSSRGRR